jgi:uncharacterized membrane protein
MTLLVLDIRVPAVGTVHTEGELWHALLELLPRFVMYAMSFLTLGIFWVGQQTQLNQLERADRDLAWLHIWFLAAVAIMPFSTRAPRRIHPVPHGAPRLLGQHSRPRSHSLLRMGVCQTGASDTRGYRLADRGGN